LIGISVAGSELPKVKTGLLTSDFQKIEFLSFGGDNIYVVEPDAFQHLHKLKWVSFYNNNLKTLSDKLFENNSDLIYIDLRGNNIQAIDPNFFDGLAKLKMIDFKDKNLCIKADIGCENCLISPADIQNNLQNCFPQQSSLKITEGPDNADQELEEDAEDYNRKIMTLKFEQLSRNLTGNFEIISQEAKLNIAKIEGKLEENTKLINEKIENLTRTNEKLVQEIENFKEIFATILQEKLNAFKMELKGMKLP
jgi:hypothetical protein